MALNHTDTYRDIFCSYYNSNTTCQEPAEDDILLIERICSANKTVAYVLFSIALVFGLPGSILALITVSRLPLKPSTLYIGLLAISDFLSLIGASLTYYKLLTSDPIEEWEEFSKWLGRIFQAFSHWLLALICLERFVTVTYPLHRVKVYTLQNTLYTCIAASALCCIPFLMFCLHYLNVVTYSKFRFISIVIYLTIYIIVPTLLIIVFTALTALQLRRSQQRRRTILTSENSERASKMEADLTRMMFLTAIFFVILTLPMAIIHILDQAEYYLMHIELCPVKEAVSYFLFYSSASLSFSNHAINFYLYLLGARGFRKQFLLVFSKKVKFQASATASSCTEEK
ncbi:C5a anaphylatoxin chemotactic receptor 1-like [Plakobranchus ocellatus]|uniref:C5a anaphylatoxin chemotactic receptor 1-like n=1 Tax=Plakobranchus ocellatus TaxID=259542 RepID=A0AAV4BS40_9GAST|nr:C5a anaphylatoxin chemotactic receptor 1-like [Plakobranchus ocellatus]